MNEFLSDCDLMIHGTTVALNTLIQLRGAKVGLLLYPRPRGLARDPERPQGGRAPLRLPLPAGTDARAHGACGCRSRERVLSDGSVRTPLDEEDVLRGIEAFRREGVEAVGVSFLWSFLHPDHERRVGEILARELPDVHVTLSVDLLPQIREYTRTSTVAVNAYVAPSLAPVHRLDRDDAGGTRLREPDPLLPVERRTHLRAGVLARARSARSTPAPPPGPARALHFAAASDQTDVLTLDVGGTSSDISLVQDGKVDLVKDVDIGRYRVGVPLVNVISIGAGGGSIAWIDAQGLLHVGPQSAEAVPGPPATCEAEPRPR